MKLLKSASDAMLGLLVPKTKAGACCTDQGKCKDVACNIHSHKRCCLNCNCVWMCSACVLN
ncbi:hypothetical protein HNR73_006935 [Phytomonospora endophytica]|uniref:Uncharacterized protein n=1 Tax=Phytomonospora endophytica TaxID=714109 RepID=A0A841FSN2_9ACTN|nr:hypothetical protein [Phytomonospora endophytica]